MLGFIIPESKPRVVSEGGWYHRQQTSTTGKITTGTSLLSTAGMCVVSFVGDDKLIFYYIILHQYQYTVFLNILMGSSLITNISK